VESSCKWLVDHLKWLVDHLNRVNLGAGAVSRPAFPSAIPGKAKSKPKLHALGWFVGADGHRNGALGPGTD
jgi:hypothetical protein